MANSQIGNRYISEFHKDIVKAVVALPAPSAALTGFRRWRTADNTEFFCDGTRWISTQQFHLPLGTRAVMPFAAVQTFLEAALPRHANGVYIEKINCGFFPNKAQNATDYYSFTANMARNDTGVTGSLGGSADTSTCTTANRYYEFDGGIVVGPSAPVWFQIQAVMTPHGSPGTFSWWATAVYRLIG